MNKFFIIIVITFCFGFFLKKNQSENLVLNGSFENAISKDSLNHDWTYLEDYEEIYWYNRYSTDCRTTINCSQVPLNDVGYQEPQNGNSYAGFGIFDKRFEYREYLVGNIKTKLIAGKKYNFCFYLNAADCSKFYINYFGVYFTSIAEVKKLSKRRYKSLSTITPTIEFNILVDDTENWVKLDMDFIAKGNETMFIIGNFKSDDHTTIKKGVAKIKSTCDQTLQYGAYYLIDNVMLYEN